MIELHTGKYADTSEAEQAKELERIKTAAKFAYSIGLKVNAGHGLHEGNVEAIAEVLEIAELNIGHAIVAEAVFKGWKAAIQDMRNLMLNSRQRAMNQKH